MKQEFKIGEMMPNTQLTGACSHFGELLAYLYGEADEPEANDFQSHLTGCEACRAEFAAFTEVRGGIVAWRDEALKPAAALAPDVIGQRVVVKSVRNRSALAAIREFFTLSPLWLKGATAFATVLLVSLLFVTALRLFERSDNQIANNAPSLTPIIEKASETVKPNSSVAVVPPSDSKVNEVVPSQIRKAKYSDSRSTLRPKLNRRSNTPALSNEELSDLLIAAKDDEESVPRLYDLLNESN